MFEMSLQLYDFILTDFIIVSLALIQESENKLFQPPTEYNELSLFLFQIVH